MEPSSDRAEQIEASPVAPYGERPRSFGALQPIVAPAILCGLCIYLPVAGLRGAAFCLFPGLAQRAWKTAIRGAIFGFFADLFVDFCWMFLAGVWEPRASYNVALVHYLPPDLVVMTHAGSPMPNSLKFGLGLVFWTSTMFVIWMALWTPRIEWSARLVILGIGVIAVGGCSVILWIVAPLDGWWTYGAAPFGDLEPARFLFVFLTTMPTCALIVGWSIRAASCLGCGYSRSRQFSLRQLLMATTFIAVLLGIVVWLIIPHAADN